MVSNHKEEEEAAVKHDSIDTASELISAGVSISSEIAVHGSPLKAAV